LARDQEDVMTTLLETWGPWGMLMIVAGVLLVMWGMRERTYVPERWRVHIGVRRIAGGFVLLALPVIALLAAGVQKVVVSAFAVG
jgi:uncharacterized membrane protein HdeD (DUF308 family)